MAPSLVGEEKILVPFGQKLESGSATLALRPQRRAWMDPHSLMPRDASGGRELPPGLRDPGVGPAPAVPLPSARCRFELGQASSRAG